MGSELLRHLLQTVPIRSCLRYKFSPPESGELQRAMESVADAHGAGSPVQHSLDKKSGCWGSAVPSSWNHGHRAEKNSGMALSKTWNLFDS